MFYIELNGNYQDSSYTNMFGNFFADIINIDDSPASAAYNKNEVSELIEAASRKRTYFANRKYYATLRSSSPATLGKDGLLADVEHQLARYSKERMRTMNGLLLLCLNLGVDPPDVRKPPDCSRVFTWIDTTNKDARRSQETIGNQLQALYTQLQQRARFRLLVDPHPVSVQTSCQSARKAAGRSERVLFHYNGHGVPLPTLNEEIWVFNEKMTKYMPLALRDLQQWLGQPTLYVFDGNCSGLVLSSFYHQWLRDQTNGLVLPEDLKDPTKLASAEYRKPLSDLVSECVVLCSCGHDELLPMDSRLPVDLFTCCLVTPIKASLLWYALRTESNRLLPSQFELKPEEVVKDDFIPGSMSERRTPFGELHWVLTAITDTIAWDSLPRGLFHGLFRHDLVLSALLRHFLVAERILHKFDCHPRTFPPLPRMHNHPLWEVWDYALDACVQQLPAVKAGQPYKPLTFFLDSLNAFEHWLRCHNGEPAFALHLPILLQVMLVQAHRERALQLLCEFVDLGSWAVCQAITVGLLPYIHRLVTNNEVTLADRLVFAWAKIVSIDKSSQMELIKCQTFKYFGALLSPDVAVSGLPSAPSTRALAAFVLTAVMVRFAKLQSESTAAHPVPSQPAAPTLPDTTSSLNLQAMAETGGVGAGATSGAHGATGKTDTRGLLTNTMLQAAQQGFVCFENDAELRQWLCLCLSVLWQSDDEAKEAGRRRSLCDAMLAGHAPNKQRPAVRAALVRALAAFMAPPLSGQPIPRGALDSMRQLAIQLHLFLIDCSPLVRLELVAALGSIAQQFDFFINTGKSKGDGDGALGLPKRGSSINLVNSMNVAASPPQRGGLLAGLLALPSSGGGAGGTVSHFDAFCGTMMRYLSFLACDPHPEVHTAANQLQKIIEIKQSDPQSIAGARTLRFQFSRRDSYSANGGDDQQLPSQGQPAPGQGQDPSPVPPVNVLSPGGGVTLGQLPSDSQLVNSNTARPLIETGLLDQAFSQIQQPLMSNANEQMLVAAEVNLKRRRNFASFNGGELVFRAGVSVSQQYVANVSRQTKDQLITHISLHPALDLMIAATSESVILVDLLNSNIVSTINLMTPAQRNQFRGDAISASPVIHTQFINDFLCDDLLMTVSGDGCLRIFDKYRSEDDTQLLTTCNLLADQFISNAQGVVGPASGIFGVGVGVGAQPITGQSMGASRRILTSAAWDQNMGILYVAGDLQFIRMWSAEVENCIQDIPIGLPFTQMLTTCVCHSSSIVSYSNSPNDLLVAGFSSGQVRAYSTTGSGASSGSILLGSHKDSVVGIRWQPKSSNVIISSEWMRGSNQIAHEVVKISDKFTRGFVRFWDIRHPNSVLNEFNSVPDAAVFDVHPEANLCLCCSRYPNGSLYVHPLSYPSQMAQVRLSVLAADLPSPQANKDLVASMGAVATFHPNKPIFATATADRHLSIYRVEPRATQGQN